MSLPIPFSQRLLTLLLLPLLIFGGVPVEVDCCCDVRSSRSELEQGAGVEAGTTELSSCCAKNEARHENSNSAPSDEGAPGICDDCQCRLVISRRNEQPLSKERVEATVAFVFTAEIPRFELPWSLVEKGVSLRAKPENRAHPPPRFLLFGNLRC